MVNYGFGIYSFFFYIIMENFLLVEIFEILLLGFYFFGLIFICLVVNLNILKCLEREIIISINI